MSSNSKNAKRHAAAKLRNRPKGYKGPASTTAKHGKKKAWFQMKDAMGRLLCLLAVEERRKKRVREDVRKTDDAPSRPSLDVMKRKRPSRRDEERV